MPTKQFNIRKKIAKHKWFMGGLVGLVIAGSLILNKQNDIQKEFQDPTQMPKIVQPGHVEYNNGDLVSYDFVRCTAVVFDYGDSALMAHATPLLEPKLFILTRKESITAGSVVEYFIQESNRLGLNPKEARAYVNAGDKKSLDKITEELKKNHIPVIKAKMRFRKGYDPSYSDVRTILYSPSRNKLSVFKESEFPDYRTINQSDWEGP